MSAAHALAGKLWMNPQCGKLELAVHEFDQALEKWTAEDGGALRFACLQNRGLCCQNLGQVEDAARDFSAAVEIEPANPTAYVNRGGALYLLRQTNAALADFQRYLDLDPKNTLGMHRTARSHILLCRASPNSGEETPLLGSNPLEPALEPPPQRRGRSRQTEGPRVALVGSSELVRVSSEVSERWYKQAALCGVLAVTTIAALVTFAVV